MVSVTTTGLGSAAIDCLGRLLDTRRDGGPLSPAVVVCGGPLIAVGVRRALGRRPGGVAGITVTTVDRLVEDLAARSLAAAGHHAASDIELQAAIRAELAERPGRFEHVAAHRTTEERLVRLHHQMAGLGGDGLERIQAAVPGLAGDAVRAIRGAIARPGPARSSDELLALALAALDRVPTGGMGPIVVFLPEPARPLEGRFVSALALRPDSEVVVGLTGDANIDGRHTRRLAGWGVQVETAAPVAPNPATVLEVADPDDEARAAIADVVAHAALGVPLARMAVLYPSADPYASLLAEHLDAAGLPWCGPGHRPLSGSLAGRFIGRLLHLARGGLDRAAVITFVSAAPVVGQRGTLIPAARWDRWSRQAGVIDGDQWEPRLRELAGELDDSEAAEVDELRAFVADLARRLDPDPPLRTWRDWGAWAGRLLDRYLPGDDHWPQPERLARQQVSAILDRLAALDAFGERPDLGALESIVSAQLADRTVPGRPFGDGLLVAPIASVGGLGFERVVVVGLAEGVYPRTPREDSLLPDRARAQSKGMLLPTDSVTDLDVRAVAAALAGAQRTPLAITARGDLRSTRSRSWPRLLNALVGQRTVLESHHRALADHGRPPSIDAFGLRALISHVDGGDPVHTHELALTDGVLAANLARGLSRRRGELSRHLGRVPAGTIDATDRLLSATALETYVSCPRSYLFGRVLRLGEDERPERIDEITASDRGTLVHAVLERFVAQSLEAESVPDPDEAWSVDHRRQLFAVLDHEVGAAQARGLTGGRVSTLILRRRLAAEMELFLETDNQLRAEHRSTPVQVELGFGFDDEPSTLELPDGRKVRLRGRVDRVDVTEDGGVLVIDYKGGSGRAFARIDANPLDGGRRLQLPLYARVVADKLGRDGPRTALYWLTKKGDLLPVKLEDDLESELDRTVSSALDGISGGLFPGVPGEAIGWPRLTFSNCRFCDFDRICPIDRQREWDSIRHDPVLQPVEILLKVRDER
jgi:hypothetical protein